jgi:hypothetical protein
MYIYRDFDNSQAKIHAFEHDCPGRAGLKTRAVKASRLEKKKKTQQETWSCRHCTGKRTNGVSERTTKSLFINVIPRLGRTFAPFPEHVTSRLATRKTAELDASHNLYLAIPPSHHAHAAVLNDQR